MRRITDSPETMMFNVQYSKNDFGSSFVGETDHLKQWQVLVNYFPHSTWNIFLVDYDIDYINPKGCYGRERILHWLYEYGYNIKHILEVIIPIKCDSFVDKTTKIV